MKETDSFINFSLKNIVDEEKIQKYTTEYQSLNNFKVAISINSIKKKTKNLVLFLLIKDAKPGTMTMNQTIILLNQRHMGRDLNLNRRGDISITKDGNGICNILFNDKVDLLIQRGLIVNNNLNLKFKINITDKVSPVIPVPPKPVIIKSTEQKFVTFRKSKQEVKKPVFHTHNPVVNRTYENVYVGLINVGLTCYMNSILQVLFHTPIFRNMIFLYVSNQSDRLHDVPLNLQSLFYKLYISDKPVDTRDLINSFGWTSDESYTEKDSVEFFTLLFQSLSNTIGSIKVSNIELSSLFKFKLHASPIFENILMMPIEQYDSVTQFIGSNTAQFSSVPNILVIQILRFVTYNNEIVKSEKSIHFEEEMSLRTSSDEHRYSLYAIVDHMGSLSSGHYFSYVKIKNQWYLFNDSITKPVNKSEAIDGSFTALSYILFYYKNSMYDALFDTNFHIPERVKKGVEMFQTLNIKVYSEECISANCRQYLQGWTNDDYATSIVINTGFRNEEIYNLVGEGAYTLWVLDSSLVPCRLLERNNDLVDITFNTHLFKSTSITSFEDPNILCLKIFKPQDSSITFSIISNLYDTPYYKEKENYIFYLEDSNSIEAVEDPVSEIGNVYTIQSRTDTEVKLNLSPDTIVSEEIEQHLMDGAYPRFIEVKNQSILVTIKAIDYPNTLPEYKVNCLNSTSLKKILDHLIQHTFEMEKILFYHYDEYTNKYTEIVANSSNQQNQNKLDISDSEMFSTGKEHTIFYHQLTEVLQDDSFPIIVTVKTGIDIISRFIKITSPILSLSMSLDIGADSICYIAPGSIFFTRIDTSERFPTFHFQSSPAELYVDTHDATDTMDSPVCLPVCVRESKIMNLNRNTFILRLTPFDRFEGLKERLYTILNIQPAQRNKLRFVFDLKQPQNRIIDDTNIYAVIHNINYLEMYDSSDIVVTEAISVRM